MTTKVAPWLEGLSEAWEVPSKPAPTNNIFSASHDAGSLRGSRSRIPVRSLSGLPSSLSRPTSASNASTQKRRNPLATLNSNESNTLQRRNGTTKLNGTRSVSDASDGSVLRGTVQQRSKSASPSKKQETLEWKRRLVRGEVGYGDQTDLFGPSGLENIFAKKDTENEAPKSKSRMGWLQKQEGQMPSSPPPWPSSFTDNLLSDRPGSGNVLDVVPEDDQQEDEEEYRQGDSFRSNPFDLEDSELSRLRPQSRENSSPRSQSSPDKAFIEPTQNDGPNDRTVSGQTELEQEDFSPVFISKHHTVTGQVDYAAIDSHMIKQFQNQKPDLRHPSQESLRRSNSEPEAMAREEPEVSAFTDGPESQSLPNVNDLSFSENLPTGSPFPGLGRHVEMKRGGYSAYGSFKRRPLSPSQSTTANQQNPDPSGLLSPIPSEAGQLPPAPTPPRTPGADADQEEPKSKSSGSPLKLFGQHDTFTNNRLLRRLSQLNPDGTIRESPVARTAREEQREVSNANSFGSGELDNHGFDAEITITSASDSDKDASDRSPGSEVPAPGSKTPLGFKFDDLPEVRDTFKLKRKPSKHSATTSKGSTLETKINVKSKFQPTIEDVSKRSKQPEKVSVQTKVYPEGKRPPTSPFKDPTPKRRRTLYASEMESDISNLNISYHTNLQEAASSRKRKDARQGDAQNTAEPSVMAQRKILRPRNPTPSQRRKQIEAELREAAEEFAEQEPEKLEAVMEQIESSMASDAYPTLEQQAHALASEVAAFTLKVQKPSGEVGERKRSVTTQDFLDEAMMVMNLIRAKARPRSNLGSVEESSSEEARPMSRESKAESLLRVSRPPSREGSGWRTRAAVHTDARVISHLRKFQEPAERDDTDFIANSIASLEVDDESHMNGQVVVVDEESNIRITGPPSDKDREETSGDSRPSTLNTQNSAGTSTGRTIGSNSSTRKSENVGTLAPDAVVHLIGEQVGGMTFDKDKQMWVRATKSPEKTQYGSFLELPSNVTSDDDPFREISDLPVDEQAELRRISCPGKVQKAEAERKVSEHDQAEQSEHQQPTVETRNTSNETVVPRPVTRDSSHIQHNHSSSVPSRYTAFASSQQQEKVETRATSWSDEELARMSAIGRAKQQPLAYASAKVALQQRLAQSPVEETSVTERQQNIPTQTSTALDYAQVEPTDLSAEPVVNMSGLREDTALDMPESEIEQLPSPKIRQTPSKPPFPTSTYRSATRQMSLRRKTLTSRFNAEVHEPSELSELSFVAPLPGDRMMSLSLSVSRNLSRRDPRQVTEVQSSPSKGNSSFILSDLPDFTIHEEDAERPSERALATRLAHHAAAEVNDRYALAVKELVKILTDVNEDREPYWEDLKSLDLHDRSLASLYGLEDFCAHVQELNVSNNSLQHLHGAPWTVRRLKARSNQLSSLTSWNHLMNLQYLDVSNNQLDYFNGLGALYHLRELRADDNSIASLNGLFELDGLLKLRLRRNKVQYVDFEGCQLQHLTSLDLSNNQITAVRNLDRLSSLETLVLDGNDLGKSLKFEKEMPHLTSLSLRNCHLSELEVSKLPNLKHLNVDDNRLPTIQGISKLKNLLTLSIERQTLPKTTPFTLLNSPLEVRTLNLSGTSIPSLSLEISFHSIRHLSLASTGLDFLPQDFGLRMPNIKTLNLNYNNLKDIRPILNIQGLESLSVCGNRLHRLRKSVATFAKMAGLRVLDVRENPLTQGFYESMIATVGRNMSLVRKVNPTDVEEDEDEEKEDGRYDFPSTSREADSKYLGRLDEDTKLRRRVYEMLLADSCKGLETLDGLALDRGLSSKKDAVWHRLVALGIIRRSQSSVLEL